MDFTQTQDLAALLRDFRASDAPWPDAPRRTAVFALELGVAALRSDNQYARDEGGRLLAEYNARVRAPEAADAFECSWLWTEVAALEGLFMADSAMLFVPRAVERCPGEARLHLAHAIISEQQWLRGTAGRERGSRHPRPVRAAMKFPGDRRRSADAGGVVSLAGPASSIRRWRLVDGPHSADTDRYVLYLTDLVRGSDSPRTWPSRRRRRSLSRGADNLAGRAVGARGVDDPPAEPWRSTGSRHARRGGGDAHRPDQFDPWWTYWLGDYRVYPAIVAKLREIAQ